MRWDDSVRAALPPASAARVCVAVRRQWRGARIYVTGRAARLPDKPEGAAEWFARDVRAAVRDAGGDDARARIILLAIVGTHQIIT